MLCGSFDENSEFVATQTGKSGVMLPETVHVFRHLFDDFISTMMSVIVVDVFKVVNIY